MRKDGDESADDTLGLARALNDAFNRGDREGFKALLTADAIQREQGESHVVKGAEEVTQNTWSYRNTFPDLTSQITDGFACGNRAALEVTLTGTYEPATYGPRAKAIAWQACLIVTTRAGKVCQVDYYANLLDIFGQLENSPFAVTLKQDSP
jgi:ketosteroid isomerase-like protein